MLRAVSYIILIVPGDLLYCTLWSETLIKQHLLLILHFPVFNFSKIIQNFSGLDIVKRSTTHCKRVNNSVTSIDVQKAITIRHLWDVYNYTFKTACRRRVPAVSLISFQFQAVDLCQCQMDFSGRQSPVDKFRPIARCMKCILRSVETAN